MGMSEFSFGKIFAAIVVIVGLLVGASVFENNPAGYVQVKQSWPSGELSVISEPGIFCQCFGSLTPYKVAGTYRFYDPTQSNDVDAGDNTVTSGPIDVRFNGGGTAGV